MPAPFQPWNSLPPLIRNPRWPNPETPYFPFRGKAPAPFVDTEGVVIDVAAPIVRRRKSSGVPGFPPAEWRRKLKTRRPPERGNMVPRPPKWGKWPSSHGGPTTFVAGSPREILARKSFLYPAFPRGGAGLKNRADAALSPESGKREGGGSPGGARVAFSLGDRQRPGCLKPKPT